MEKLKGEVELQKLMQQIDSMMSAKKKKCDEEIKSLTDELDASKLQIEQLNQTISEKNSEIDSINEQHTKSNDEFKLQISALRQEVLRMTQQYEAMCQRAEQSCEQRMADERGQIQRKLSEFKSQLDAFLAEKAGWNRERTELSQRLDDATRLAQTRQTELDKLREAARQQAHQFTRKQTDWSEQKRRLEDELGKSVEAHAVAEQRLAETRLELGRVSDRIAGEQKQRDADKVNQLETRCAKLREQHRSQSSEMDALKDSLRKKNEKLASLQAQMQQQQADKESTHANTATPRAHSANKKQHEDEVEMLRECLKQLRLELSQKQKESELLNLALSKATEKAALQQRQSHNATQMNSESSQENEQLRLSLSSIQLENQILKQQLQAYKNYEMAKSESIRNDSQDNTNRVEKLKISLCRCQLRCQQLQSSLNEKTQTLNQLTEKYILLAQGQEELLNGTNNDDYFVQHSKSALAFTNEELNRQSASSKASSIIPIASQSTTISPAPSPSIKSNLPIYSNIQHRKDLNDDPNISMISHPYNVAAAYLKEEEMKNLELIQNIN